MWDSEITQEIVELFEPVPWWDKLTARLYQKFLRAADKYRISAVPRDPDTPCPGCGKHFHKRRGWLRTYCSDSCRAKYHNVRISKEKAAQRKPLQLIICSGCHNKIKPRASGGKPQKWCSDKCRRKHARD